MNEGIHYEEILEQASCEEKIALCQPKVAELLIEIKNTSFFLDDQINKISAECIDKSSIANALQAEQWLDLIKRCCNNETDAMIKKISNFFDLPNKAEKAQIVQYMQRNPKEFSRFIKNNISLESTTNEATSENEADCPNNSNKKISSIFPKHGLRYYQLFAARTIVGKLQQSPYCVMYHAPTGSGKTRTAMAVVTQHFRMHGPTTILWLAASAELIKQAENAFRIAWESHGDVECGLRLWYGDALDFRPEDQKGNNNMIIVGLQKAGQAINKNPDLVANFQGVASLVVFDEAHQSVAPTYRQIIKGLRESDGCGLLGLSATPGRMEEKETDKLVSLYKGEKCTIWFPENYNDPITYLESEQYLAHSNFHEISPTINIDGKIFDNKIIIICDTLQKALQEGHKRILVFAPSVNAAFICDSIVKAVQNNVESFFLSADTAADKRTRILEEYSNRDNPRPHVIFNYNILTTGFDAPCTSCVIIARATDSVGLYSQMVGRAIRGEKSGGNKYADIYTVVDTSVPEFSDVVRSFTNWEQRWREND